MWGFFSIEHIFHVFGQLVILSRSAEREKKERLLPAYLKDGGCHSRGESHQQRDKERSLMKIRNRTGPRILPWGTPALTGKGEERIPLRATCWL